MKRFLALALLLVPVSAVAQTPPQAKTYRDATGSVQQVIGVVCIPAVDGSGCAASDATAANQAATNTKLDQLHTDLIAPTAAGTNLIGKVGLDQTAQGTSNAVAATGLYKVTPTTLTDGQFGTIGIDQRQNLRAALFVPGTAVGIAGGSATRGMAASIGIWANSQNQVFNGSLWDTANKPNAVGRIASSAASTNATLVKASAGEVHNVIATNTTASIVYLKLYNKSSAAPVPGTDTPFMTIAIPASGSIPPLQFPNGGMYFSTGIGFALTTGPLDSDTTAVTAGAIVGLNITIS